MMKKLFYILCLLVFVACSDDDDKNEVMSDFDKPFTSISKSELKGMLQDFWGSSTRSSMTMKKDIEWT